MTGESKTKAIRSALAERKERLSYRVSRRNRRDELLCAGADLGKTDVPLA